MHAGERQIFDAYHAMANEAKYQPGIRGDIAGTVEIPEEEFEADVEAAEYLAQFKREERDGFYIGVPDYEGAKSMVYAIEAARLICQGSLRSAKAKKLLEMAVAAMPEVDGEAPG
jgi:hypothetical protein